MNDMPRILQNIDVDRLARALCLLILCLFIMKRLLRLSRKMLSQVPNLEPTMSLMLQRVLKGILLFLIVMAVISTAGIPITSFVALFSVIGVAVSLAAQGVLSNALGGILIVFSHPFRIGNYISVHGEEGRVEEIGFLYTKLRTADNKTIFVPNSLTNSSTITNYDEAGTRRADISVSASYDNTPEQVRQACMEAVSKYIEDILPDPAPAVHLVGYGDSNINYSVRFWVKAAKYWDVYFGVNEEIYSSFARHHVTMSYPQSMVRIKKE